MTTPQPDSKAVAATPPRLTDTEAEAALRNLVESLFAGDMATFMAGISSQAYVELLKLVQSLQLPRLEGYHLSDHEQLEDGHRFTIHLTAPGFDLRLDALLRPFKGAWRIDSVHAVR